MNAPICRAWEIVIDFRFPSLEKVIEDISKSYKSCDPEEYGGLKDKKLDDDKPRVLAAGDKNLNPHNVHALRIKPIYFREIFSFNFLCFAFNLVLTFQIINKVIEIRRYRDLKHHKLKLYRWLFREKKCFDSQVIF